MNIQKFPVVLIILIIFSVIICGQNKQRKIAVTFDDLSASYID
jgi:hypothetical protein